MSEAKGGWLSRLKIDRYLLLIIAMVVAASILPARGPAAVGFDWATRIAIGLVFFLHGARLSREAVIGGLTHWRLHLVVLASTFALFPLLCLGLAALPPEITPPALAGGIVFLGCLPSTIQSSIGFTVIARGNVAAAVAAASASNLLGILITPLLVGVLMHRQGAVSAHSAWAIVLQLLAPFLAGQVLRRWIGGFVARHATALQRIDRGSILLVVYSAFSAAVVNGVWQRVSTDDLVMLFIMDAVLLALVLVITAAAARMFGFSKQDEVTIVFCGAQKTLATGVPMANVLFPGAQAGVVILPLMIYHQLQLTVCAWLAQRYARVIGKPEPVAAE